METQTYTVSINRTCNNKGYGHLLTKMKPILEVKYFKTQLWIQQSMLGSLTQTVLESLRAQTPRCVKQSKIWKGQLSLKHHRSQSVHCSLKYDHTCTAAYTTAWNEVQPNTINTRDIKYLGLTLNMVSFDTVPLLLASYDNIQRKIKGSVQPNYIKCAI